MSALCPRTSRYGLPLLLVTSRHHNLFLFNDTHHHYTMSHSKRNTSLAFFTSYERSLLRTHWGSQSTRLTRDSFLPFGSCQLCLLPCQDPMACSGGQVPSTSTSSSTPASSLPQTLKQCHIFCRECILSNLVAQRKDLKRVEREAEARAVDAQVVDAAEDEEARRRAVVEFEAVQNGLETRRGAGAATAKEETARTDNDHRLAGPKAAERGEKRKFALDEEELLRIARDDRAKARKALSDEKVCVVFYISSHFPTSWAPNRRSRRRKQREAREGTSQSS